MLGCEVCTDRNAICQVRGIERNLRQLSTQTHTHTLAGVLAKVAEHTHNTNTCARLERTGRARQFHPLNTSLKNHLESHFAHESKKGSYTVERGLYLKFRHKILDL